MSPRKAIDLGHGRSLDVDYAEFKIQLQQKRVDPEEERKLLTYYFPAEYVAEQKAALAMLIAANAAQLRQFNETRWVEYLKSTSSKHSIVYPVPRGYRLYSHQDIVGFVKEWSSSHRVGQHQYRVTDFSHWILEAMHGPGDSSKQDAGKAGEREVAKTKVLRLKPLPKQHLDWQLIDRDPLDQKPKPRKISKLRIGNRSLVGAPDYVFHSQAANTILIIEVKVSPAWLPPDGWANLRAQLWAYGNIDHYVGLARNIILIGEVWRHGGGDHVVLAKTYRWSMSDTKFCSQNLELFEIYQNWIDDSRVSD